MTESQITWALTLVTVWSIPLVPLIGMTAVIKFMDIMRRREDGDPW